jgi:hypothetical protein
VAILSKRQWTFNGLHPPEDRALHKHRCENLKSYIVDGMLASCSVQDVVYYSKDRFKNYVK